MVSISEKEAYIEGRLLGLQELVTLLKELVSTTTICNESLAKTLVSHISQEMQEIIQALQGVQETKQEIAPVKAKMDTILKKLRAKTKEIKKKEEIEPEEFEEHIKSADELMKDLAAIKKSTKKKEEESEEEEEEGEEEEELESLVGR